MAMFVKTRYSAGKRVHAYMCTRAHPYNRQARDDVIVRVRVAIGVVEFQLKRPQNWRIVRTFEADYC